MSEQPTYQYTCITPECPDKGKTYRTDREAVIGQPCSKHPCPLGNPHIVKISRLTRLQEQIDQTSTVVLAVTAVAGGSVALFDIAGLGALAIDFLLTFFIQFSITFIVFGVWFTLVITAFKGHLKRFVTRRILLTIFFIIVAVLIVPFVADLIRRPVESLDWVRTILLGLSGNLLTKYLEPYLA